MGLPYTPRDWKVKSSGAGYVLRFEVEKPFLERYDVHQVGGRSHIEYWIPAHELDEFNRHIVGAIELVDEFGGTPGT